MKKTNNKGFSLVELIIVIAIMAILAGAIAPALIKYIDKSRKSNDVSSAKTIKTAVETALGTEEVYETLTNPSGTNTAVILKFTSGATVSAWAATDASRKYVTVINCDGNPNANVTMTDDEIAKAVASNIGEKIPKTKYKKEIAPDGTKDGTGDKFTPSTYYAFITKSGTVFVVVGGDTTPTYHEASGTVAASFENGAQLAPEVCKGYQ